MPRHVKMLRCVIDIDERSGALLDVDVVTLQIRR